MNILDVVDKQRVLILGLGREGVSTYQYLHRRFPKKNFGLADTRDKEHFSEEEKKVLFGKRGTKFHLGEKYLESIAQYDVVIKSAGILPFLPEIEAAKKDGKLITSQLEIFFEVCPGKIIGVTGTKGKSTTTSAIYHVLKIAKKPARLAGNIGIPVLSTLERATKDTIFVLELSSFQLMSLKKSPAIAVIQNIVFEHADYHQTFEKYVDAKSNIARFQDDNDVILYNASYPIPKKIASLSPGKKIGFSSSFVEDMACFVHDGLLCVYWDGKRKALIPVSDLPLRGDFNVQNIMPAVIIGKIFGVTDRTLRSALKSFRALPHRLEFIGKTKKGIQFFNDSLSTVPEATLAALRAFEGEEIVLIAGGFDRHQNFSELAKIILFQKVKALILFEPTGRRLWQEILKQASPKSPPPEHAFVKDMESAVAKAHGFSHENDIILLSPASPSFGIFKDYADRGDRFREEAQQYINKKIY